MKRILQTILGLMIVAIAHGQGSYYWVGGTTGTWTSSASWNTQLDGTGSPRSTANAADVLIFDGTNIGGASPATGQVTPVITSSVGIGQLILQNGANMVLSRNSSGTSTFTINGDGLPADDLVVGSSSILNVAFNVSGQSFVLQLGIAAQPIPATGKILGTVNINGTSTSRLVSMNTGALSFESGSNANMNLTAASSYPFGSNTQGVEKGIVFQSGANLNYLGGNSPMGNQQAYSAIDFRAGSVWHHRGTNAVSGAGSFFNTKFFGNIIVENNATLACDGPLYRVFNLHVTSGATFITHSSGQTSILGDLLVDGTFTCQPTTRNNTIVMGGNSPQAISGAGTIIIPSLTVADNAEVNLNRSINTLDTAINIYGKINFNSYQLAGAGTFNARVNNTANSITGNLVAGSYQVSGIPVNTIGSVTGLTVTGTGIAPNTSVVAFSGGNGVLSLSQAIVSNGTGVTLSFNSDTATLATSHSNGLDSTSGSVTVIANKNFQSGVNYIINGATSWPFGISSGSTNNSINAGTVTINAPVTVNRGVNIYSQLNLNNKLTLRPLDTLRIKNGAVIGGTIGNSSYVVTTSNSTSGDESILLFENPVSPQLLPIGTANYYLPATITLPVTDVISASVFQGITANGRVNGTALSPSEKQTAVDAVWRINNTQPVSPYQLKLEWPDALEGSTFTTLPGTDIGVSANNGSVWALVTPGADNLANNATATVSNYGSFSLGTVPQTQPFVFNSLPLKTYGDADFNGGATSLNTTQTIVYSSSNPSVATIVNGNIHIVGAGTSNITASQSTDGFYPAASLMQVLTVNKAALTITAADKTKYEGEALPILNATYAGFVNGETPAVLLTAAVISTTATAASPVGTYPITVSGATAANYTINFVNGTLSILAKTNQTITFNALPVKTYGNADFAAGASSTNATIPITYASSNTGVATIVGNNIHIVGAGTANITASQAGSAGFFPATNVVRSLTVNKAALTIRVRDTTKVEGMVNPTFTFTYTGFVLGETATSLTTPPTVTTDATTASPAGYYTLTPGGAVTNNYTITYTTGRLTILPTTGAGTAHLHVFMPNSTTLNVRIYSTYPALSDIGIFDMNGKLVIKKNVFLPEGFINTTIPVGGLPSGIYIVKVVGSGVDLESKVPIIH